jgi:hypothetical protein
VFTWLSIFAYPHQSVRPAVLLWNFSLKRFFNTTVCKLSVKYIVRNIPLFIDRVKLSNHSCGKRNRIKRIQFAEFEWTCYETKGIWTSERGFGNEEVNSNVLRNKACELKIVKVWSGVELIGVDEWIVAIVEKTGDRHLMEIGLDDARLQAIGLELTERHYVLFQGQPSRPWRSNPQQRVCKVSVIVTEEIRPFSSGGNGVSKSVTANGATTQFPRRRIRL